MNNDITMTIPKWIVKLCQFAECPVFLFSKSGHSRLHTPKYNTIKHNSELPQVAA